MLPKEKLEGAAAPEPEETQVSCLMDAVLPMSVSPKWVAYACRMAGVAKPRWSRESGVWTSSVLKDNGVAETITIVKGKTDRTIQVKVEWIAWNGEPSETATARRFITTLITGMQWSLRQRTQTRMSLAAVAGHPR